ncbi:peroxin-19, partial [Phenoliferia sp. Uapishka_3]
MAPPAARHDEEDLDDLDDLASEFSPSPSKPSAPTPSPSAPASAPADFPDPDDEPLEEDDDIDSEEFNKEFQASMAEIMGQLGNGTDDEAIEFQKMMEGLLKGGGEGDGGELDPAQLLAALGGGGGFPGMGMGGGPAKAKGKTSSNAKAGPSSTPSTPANFQDTIKKTMSKMKESNTTVETEKEAKETAGDDPLAAMMAQMAGLGDMGGEEGIQGMLDEMMEQLMSRDLLYVPLKELSEKYPAYLEENAATLDKSELARFKKQQIVVDQIVAKFEEPGADKETAEGLSESEFAKRRQRQLDVAELVKEMNDNGAPPASIMGEMPEGMELGADGVPKLPADCTIS